MWCLAPDWPEHAHHVAVEFVHPVIMGKRALPAVAVTDDDPVAALRAHRAARRHPVRGRAAPTSALVRTAMQRARGWGLTTVWVGAGPRDRPRRRPTTCSGSTAQRARPRTTAASCCATTCCGSSRTCASSTQGSSRAGRRVRRDAHVRHLLRRRRVAEVVTVDAAGLAAVRTGRGTETIDVNAGRCPSAPAISCWCTPARPSRVPDAVWRASGDERGHRLPLPVHRAATSATPVRCSPTSPRRPWPRPRRAPRSERRRSSATRRPRSTRPPTRWPTASRRRPAASRSATAGARPTPLALAALFARPPRGRAAAGPLPRRRPGGAHRARQRRRLRPRVRRAS